MDYSEKHYPFKKGTEYFKVEKTNTTKHAEKSSEKAVHVGCGLVGAAWFAFIGISFVACLLMGLGGCLKGCTMKGAYTDQQLERLP